MYFGLSNFNEPERVEKSLICFGRAKISRIYVPVGNSHFAALSYARLMQLLEDIKYVRAVSNEGRSRHKKRAFAR